MTDFGDIDLDLLADYLGGALDGTPDAERVATLVSDDPRWASAHAELSAAMASVGADLGAWGATPEPMPADLAVRLDRALTTVDEAPAGGARPGSAVRPGAGVAVDRRLTLVPGRDLDRVRRRLRWAVPVATAAGVLAFAGFGLDYLGGSSADDAGSSAARPGAAEQPALGGKAEDSVPLVAAASAGAVAAEPAEDDILASGINYQPATLRAEDERLAAGGKPVRRSDASEPALEAGSGDDGLFRLQVRAALRACLEAISAANGSGPIAVQSVDYARYLSNPALIVRFAAANGRFVWVSGPDCGTPPGAADTRARVQVGS